MTNKHYITLNVPVNISIMNLRRKSHGFLYHDTEIADLKLCDLTF